MHMKLYAFYIYQTLSAVQSCCNLVVANSFAAGPVLGQQGLPGFGQGGLIQGGGESGRPQPVCLLAPLHWIAQSTTAGDISSGWARSLHAQEVNQMLQEEEEPEVYGVNDEEEAVCEELAIPN
jgi:hypothetical protein